ncbi:MAG: N-acetylneuraminate synthase family protein [Gemmatimonadetes bacterium]|nr:N-acetylneuraminate synthase family protein [Gemmatimonadota bacterium]
MRTVPARTVHIGPQLVGDDQPCFVIAEIGINHNGQLDLAFQLIDAAIAAGCNAVKFQKRTPERCVTAEQAGQMRQTPWGYISYLEYRHKVEFDRDAYEAIDRYCRERGIAWLASCWDEPSVDFIEAFDPPAYKVHSAAITDGPLLRRLRATGRPLIVSTGMSTMGQIDAAVALLRPRPLVLVHATSAYPCALDELNLRMIPALRHRFPDPIGYSGHEVGIPTTVAAVALGASVVERHLTLDRSMWGSDHAASVEPGGFDRMVKYIRSVEAALGDGVKRVYESERAPMARLRRSFVLEDVSPDLAATA